jgi:hypothetical protein
MKYATERKIIHHGGAYHGSLNAQQSIISNRTRKRDALFGPSDDGASNCTNESIYGGLEQLMEFIDPARQCSFLGIFAGLYILVDSITLTWSSVKLPRSSRSKGKTSSPS